MKLCINCKNYSHTGYLIFGFRVGGEEVCWIKDVTDPVTGEVTPQLNHAYRERSEYGGSGLCGPIGKRFVAKDDSDAV